MPGHIWRELPKRGAVAPGSSGGEVRVVAVAPPPPRGGRLLSELSTAAHISTGRQRREAFGLLATGYYCAHGLASRLGHGDLA